MAELVLGAEPDLLTIPLYPGVPWWAMIELSPPLVDGEELGVVFDDGGYWPGSLNADRTVVTFSVSAIDVDARLAAEHKGAWLRLVNFAGEAVPWAIGSAVLGKVGQ